MSEISTAAIEYIKKGWVVHPLSRPKDDGNSPGKRPLLTGWQYLTTTPPDLDKYLSQGCNIGLVCGKASGVDGLDLDHDIFEDELLSGVEINTLISGHRIGRGHLIFQHEIDMHSEKHHFIGIEYFGNNSEGAGSNLVLPPSIHHSGEVYKWKNPNAPLMKMPETLKENIKSLFKREDELHEYFKKCRHCFTRGCKKYSSDDPRSKGLWERPDDVMIHGMDGRRAILAIMGELRAEGCPDNLLHMACKRFFVKEYNFKKTQDELKHVKPIRPECETMRQYLNVDCDGCNGIPNIQGKKQKKEKTPEKGIATISTYTHAKEIAPH